jgi:hypothetical protein
MKNSYRVIDAEEGKRLNAPIPPWEDGWDDLLDSWYPSSYLYRFEDDIPVEFIGQDGGEPEDQTFSRDWGWVTGALQDAYQLGRKHGANAEYDRLRDKV